MIYGMMQLARKIKVQNFFKLPEQPDMSKYIESEQKKEEAENGNN
jgi:hypothetical protein